MFSRTLDANLLWTNPEKKSHLMGKFLKFMLEISQGSEALQIIKFAQHTEEAAHVRFQGFTMSIFRKCLYAYDLCSCILALFELC